MAKIAFLGLGKMGLGMAGCFVESGHEVTVWNRSSEKCMSLVEKGAALAPSPAEAAKEADAVFSMVSDDDASQRIWLDADGAFREMNAGAIAIECSTISHNHVNRLASAAEDRNISYVDAPVNGPPSAAAEGNLVLLVGAKDNDLKKARPLLDVISQSILHFGPVGSGTAFKLINNLLGAVHIASIAEAVHLAQTLDLDVETLIAAVESGPCASPHVLRMIRPMAEQRLADQFGLAIGLREKDSRYCLEMAEAAQAGMSVGSVAYNWYKMAIEHLADQDDSALLRITKECNGKVANDN